MGEKYCVMNTQKRGRQDVRGLQAEANRECEDYKNDVDKSRTKDNVYLVKSDDWHKSISDVLESENIQEKDNSVVLLTSVYTYSPEWGKGKSQESIMDFFRTCFEYEKSTKGTVINAVIHMDETTPHMQVATVPVVDVPDRIAIPVMEQDKDGNMVQSRYTSGKSKGKPKYKREVVKNEDGSIKTHRGLNAAYIIGNKAKMSRTQTEFWEQCGKPFGMERGEIRVETDKESKAHLTEAEYKAQQIVKEAEKKAQAVRKSMELEQKRQENNQRVVERKLQQRENAVLCREDAVRRHEREVKEDLDRRIAVVEAQERVLQNERQEFTARVEKWQETANKRLEQALADIKDSVHFEITDESVVMLDFMDTLRYKGRKLGDVYLDHVKQVKDTHRQKADNAYKQAVQTLSQPMPECEDTQPQMY